MFNIEMSRMAIALVPQRLRQPKLLGYLLALTAPVRTVYNAFTAARNSNLYRLSHNGQVCYLEAVLNDSFDPDQRRIFITDADSFVQKYIYTEAEQQPVYLGTMYLRSEADYTVGSYDFKVVVPLDFNMGLYGYQIKALINAYKLVGTKYKIERQ